MHPHALLAGPFEVKDEITPIAAHCCGVIGAVGWFVAAVF
jgi:hypothetical protein